jgi:hypothetical protein
MVETSEFKRFVLPTAAELGKSITDYATNDLATQSRHERQAQPLHHLMATCIDTFSFGTVINLTNDGPHGYGGAISLGAEDSAFTDNRKRVLSLTSPLPLLYATSLKKIIVHLMPDPVNPLIEFNAFRNPHRRTEKSSPRNMYDIPRLRSTVPTWPPKRWRTPLGPQVVDPFAR